MSIIDLFYEKIDTSKEIIYKTSLLFSCIFIYNIIFFFQGIDVIDNGYHLTCQILAFNYFQSTIPSETVVFLTNYIGGFWLNLLGGPSLLWARIGGSILLALNAIIIYSILSDYFEERNVFYIVLFSSILLSSFDIMSLIHYYSFPAFLISINLFLFNKLINKTSNYNHKTFFEIGLGLMFTIITLSKFTMIIFPAFTILLLISIISIKEDWLSAIKCFCNILIGILISCFFFGIIYWNYGFLENYLTNIFTLIQGSSSSIYPGHSLTLYFETMLNTYTTIFFYIIQLILIFIALLLLFFIIKKFIKNKVSDLFIFFISLFTAFFLLFQMFPFEYFFETYGVFFSTIVIVNYIVGALILLSIIYFVKNKNSDYKITSLILLGLLEIIIMPLGSSTANFWAFEGMWLIMPLLLLCTLRSIEEMKSTFNKTLLKSIFTSFLIVLIIFSVFFHSINVFYDNSNRFELNEGFSDESLTGIYSSSDRVKVIDELLYEIRQHSDKEDRIFLLNQIPMFYYLSDRLPPQGITPMPETLSIEYLEQNQERLEIEDQLPKLLIYSKVNTNSKIWIYPENEPYLSIRGDKLEYTINKYVNKLNYTLLWQNKAFIIYGNPQ